MLWHAIFNGFSAIARTHQLKMRTIGLTFRRPRRPSPFGIRVLAAPTVLLVETRTNVLTFAPGTAATDRKGESLCALAAIRGCSPAQGSSPCLEITPAKR